MNPLLFAMLVSLLGGKRSPPPMPAPPPALYLRSGFDADPSTYLGRFLPADAVDIDESNAMITRCSTLVTPHRIAVPGVTFIEQMSVSTAAAVRIGVPLVAGVEASHQQTQIVRVEYTLQSKLVAEIEDPVAFEACCKAAPDQCTERYISEFYEGTGAVSYAKATETRGKAKGMVQTVAGSVEGSRETDWVRSITFQEPVFFAFKTSRNAFPGQSNAACGPWTEVPPKSTQGIYVVGVSPPSADEASAREAAMHDARLQIGLEGPIKDEAWCITPRLTPDGTVVLASVLAFLPSVTP